MSSFNFSWRSITLLMLITTVVSCKKEVSEEPPLVVQEDPAQAAANAAEVRKNTAAQLADGLTLTLWASDSLAPDPVAMSIDDAGNIYLTRTNRQKNSEFDIRGYRHWMTQSISWQTVEDRRAFLHEFFAPERSKENEWLADLNNDGSHDWRDLAVEKDEIWKLEDRSGDGIADVSTRILNDFHDEVTDVAEGLLVRENDMFLAIAPDLWRLRDTDGNGIIDEKTSISHGYAVHIGFSGHGLSGVTQGPDGKIYWSIGDIGANIKAPDGTQHEYPNEGIIVRANPDGSDFEVFAAGLRNIHEFVFDEYGNIISADNDGDHRGESERLVYIVEGSDAGWRSNWQYGKYTDPRNNQYKVWMDEGFYKPRWEGQASHIIPPIVNFHNGPTGMAYNPGTALGSEWKNKFFLVEFVGNPSRSHVWAFSLKPKGASFELAEDIDVVNGILPTGIRFGPDGALYVADWINGWGTKNYGRVWKIDVNEDKNDLKEVRAQTKQLIQSNYQEKSEDDLKELLAYGDMRVRQKAQFELVHRKAKGAEVLREVAQNNENQLARVHAIWGIGQLAAADATLSESLVGLLGDRDAEIITQAAKVLGDIRHEPAAATLTGLLKHENERVKFFAAQALGRMKHADAVPALLSLIEKNNDEDLYIRHAAVLALSRIGQEAPITALVDHESKALRTAAVLVLRRMKNDKVAMFLKDSDELVVTDAARAINDDVSIPGALPALAEVLNETRFKSEALLRRGINACLRVGGEKELDILMKFAMRSDVAPAVRSEALASIGTWSNPSVLDRVDGRYRGKVQRSPEPVIAKVKENVSALLNSNNSDVLTGTASMLGELGIGNYNDQLEKIMTSNGTPEVRSSMLIALHKLKHSNIENVIRTGMNDKDGSVRTTAISLLNGVDISKEKLPAIVQPIFSKGTVEEQQEMLRVLGDMPNEKSEPVLDKLLDQLAAKKLSPALTLDLIEAVDSTHSEKLITKLNPIRSTGTSKESFSETLYGGNAWAGRDVFMTNSTAQCVRCHTLGNQESTVGPPLAGIGDRLSREQLLEALIEPSARLAPGFGSVRITLKGGQVVTGILLEESKEEIKLRTAEAEPLEIPVSRISKRENLPSSMPPMRTLLSKREIRDVVEFLANLKTNREVN
jgi:putative membrane-bound dehydrogenase-like protein